MPSFRANSSHKLLRQRPNQSGYFL